MRLALVELGTFFFFCVGCSGDNSQGDAGDAGSDAPPYAAQHTPMPKVVSSGGPVMTAPKLVPISFTSDSASADVDTFATQLVAAKDYWKGTTSEYGVGALTAATPIHLSETPTPSLTDADVQTWLTGKIQTDASFPQPDDNTLYAIFYPDTVTVTAGTGVTCQEFQGYHDAYLLGGQHVIYTVVPRCPPPPVAGVTVLDEMTAEASHEIVEAATDPFPTDTPAYLSVGANDLAWALLAGGETGDMCAAFPGAFYRPPGVDHLVQRTWSNAAAAASHDPCQPAGLTPYFNSAPVLPDMITVSAGGQTASAQGVLIPIGQSKTIELDLYSDAPTSGPWTVSVIDITSMFFGGTAALSFTLDQTQGQNGDKLQLTIKSLKSVSGGAPFWIQNDLGGSTTVWIGAVNSH